MNEGAGSATAAFTDRCEHGLSWREAGDGRVADGNDAPGRPVIFLHGLGGTRSAWGPQLRGLASTFRCVAWDMPGYGSSDVIRPLTYDAIAQRLVDLIDVLGAEQADLVGLSFGGMHALHTAINHPDRVRRLVLANTSPAFGMDGTTREDWQRDRLAMLDHGGRPADGAERVIDLIAGHPLTGDIRRETVASFGEISAEGFRAAVECLPDNDVRDRLSAIQHPALVIAGELDRETPPSYARVLHDGLPNSRIEVLADVGHLSPAESPDRFNQLVTDFLESPR